MLPPDIEGLYDAFEHSRASRVELPLLSPDRARSYCRTVRSAALDALDALPDDPPDEQFTFGMVVSHENQHDETMLQALNLRTGTPLLGGRPPGCPRAGRDWPERRCWCPAARSCWAWTPRANRTHWTTNVPPTWSTCRRSGSAGFRSPTANGNTSSTTAVTPSRGGGRIAAGSIASKAGLTAPQFWTADGRTRTRFGYVEDIPADEPVQHVTYFEAEAYAAWAGARLPTEMEWEKACAWDPARDSRRRYPWGDDEPSADRANLGGTSLRPAPVGAYPAGASAYGAEQMLGDVWEWTSSPLRPWPGFVPMIYERYSQPFFDGDYRVLRGGSWAVEPAILRPSFRNWDHPYRRQIFSGVRLAWDVRRLMCRHLGWLGAPVTVSSLVLDPPYGSAGAVLCAAPAKARSDERRRLGGRVFRRS